MDALRTQADNLQWEVHHLDVENRKLKEQNPEGVDHEAELERDVAELTDNVRTYEQQLAEKMGVIKSTE